MGEVYRARDTRLDRTVALKVMPADLAADPQFRARFDREARAISRLQHQHICTLLTLARRTDSPMRRPSRTSSPGVAPAAVVALLEEVMTDWRCEVRRHK